MRERVRRLRAYTTWFSSPHRVPRDCPGERLDGATPESGPRLRDVVWFGFLPCLAAIDLVVPGFVPPLVIVLTFALAIASEYRRDKTLVLTGLFIVYYFLGNMVSALLISHGAYMSEVEKYGINNGVMGLLLAAFVVMWLPYRAGYRCLFRFQRIHMKGLGGSQLCRVICFGASTFVLMFMAVLYLRHGSPILLGVTRTEFFNSIPRVWRYLNPVTTVFVFFPMLLYLATPYKALGLMLIALVLIGTFFVLGQKFTAFVQILAVMAVCVACYRPHFHISWKVGVLSVVLLSIVLSSLIYIYTDRGDVGPWVHIYQRAVLQAQVPWSGMNEGFSWGSGLWPSGGLEEMRNIIGSRYLPHGYFVYQTSHGYALTSFFPVSLLLAYGVLMAGALTVAVSFIAGVVMRFIVTQLTAGRILTGVLAYIVYVALLRVLFASSGFGVASAVASCLLLYACVTGSVFSIATSWQGARP